MNYTIFLYYGEVLCKTSQLSSPRKLLKMVISGNQSKDKRACSRSLPPLIHNPILLKIFTQQILSIIIRFRVLIFRNMLTVKKNWKKITTIYKINNLFRDQVRWKVYPTQGQIFHRIISCLTLTQLPKSGAPKQALLSC